MLEEVDRCFTMFYRLEFNEIIGLSIGEYNKRFSKFIIR